MVSLVSLAGDCPNLITVKISWVYIHHILVSLKCHTVKTLVYMTDGKCTCSFVILTHHGCMTPVRHWGWSRRCWWPRCSERRTSWAASTSAWWLWTWCWGPGPPQPSPARIRVYELYQPAGDSTRRQVNRCKCYWISNKTGVLTRLEDC